MSKNKRTMTRKRFTKLVAAQYHLQIPAVRDALMHGCVYQSKRDQERSNMENHRYKTQKTAEFICKFFHKGSMIAVDGSLQTRNYQDKQGNKRTAVEVVASNISFAGAKAADKPAARGFDQQTQNYTREAKTAQSTPQPAYTQGSMDDFSEIPDSDDLPF